MSACTCICRSWRHPWRRRLESTMAHRGPSTWCTLLMTSTCPNLTPTRQPCPSASYDSTWHGATGLVSSPCVGALCSGIPLRSARMAVSAGPTGQPAQAHHCYIPYPNLLCAEQAIMVSVIILCCLSCVDRHKLTPKNINNTQYVACMNPTAGSFIINPRLQRLFMTLAVDFPGQDSLMKIYGTFLQVRPQLHCTSHERLDVLLTLTGCGTVAPVRCSSCANQVKLHQVQQCLKYQHSCYRAKVAFCSFGE